MTLQGIIPPVPTPFKADGRLAPEDLQTLIGRLEPDVDGFLILGSNGEAVYLSEAERREALRAAREVIPKDKPMIAGTGGEATQTVIEWTQQAADIGADYALVVAPHYFLAAMTEDVLEQHYTRVADESPIPVLLYNVPAATTLSLSPGLVARLATHPNIVGIKDSSGAIGALTEIMRQVPEDFTVLTGNAPTLLPALSLGARGGILAVANVAPQAYGELYQAFQSGEIDRARAIQLRFNPLARAVTSRYGVSGLKATLGHLGLTAGLPRSPLRDVSQEIKDELRNLLSSLELL